jgi:hypothetical protein
MRKFLPILLFLVIAAVGLQLNAVSVEACGGLFCQTVPVDQQAERIIFTVNDDDTISAYVQINYTGSAPDFSWVVPVPSVPEIDVAEIETFDELSNLTQPVFIPPVVPDCAMVLFDAMDDGADGRGGGVVDVLAAGSVGPYDYVVVDSPEPNALITWLRENGYQITEAMEPLVHVYNEEGMVFLAMKLQPDQGAQDIQPVKMTYESTKPMIPLRLTAVAANPDMNVVTWIFADAQAYPTNYAHPKVDDSNIRFAPPVFGGGHNYTQLVDQTVDLYDGRAFVTEYADSTSILQSALTDPLLQSLFSEHGYVTRFFGRISPEEMTVDPVFDFSADMPDVSNIHDLSAFDPEVVYSCTSDPVVVEYDEDVVPDGWK